MENDNICSCTTCGYQWKRGLHGGHSCSESLNKKINKAKELICQFGGIDGEHHKSWVIDQVFRELTGSDYESLVAEAKNGNEDPETYSWDEGIAP